MARVFKNSYQYKVELTSEMNVSFFYVWKTTQKELAEEYVGEEGMD